MEYLAATTKPKAKGKGRAASGRRARVAKSDECLFCRVAAERRDRANLVIARPRVRYSCSIDSRITRRT